MTATEPKPKLPLAVLFLPESRSRMVLIYGRSGQRYTFQANGVANGRPARVYHDADTFTREEGDIRRNLRGIMAVCTIVGEADPLAKALSAVEAIAQSSNSVGAGGVKAQLLRVQGAIAEALAPLEDTESSTGQPAPESCESSISEELNTADPGRIYTKADLHALSLDEVRILAKARGITGLRKRADLTDAILARQATTSTP